MKFSEFIMLYVKYDMTSSIECVLVGTTSSAENLKYEALDLPFLVHSWMYTN